MKIFENWKNVIEKAQKLDRKSLEAIRFAFFGAVVIDLFGIYWYLGFKKLGGALLIVLIMALALVLILERNLPPLPKSTKKFKKEDKKMDEEETKESKEEEQESLLGNFDIGLGSAEEYKKRAEEALGTMPEL